MGHAQAHYKPNHDASMRNFFSDPQLGGSLFVRAERAQVNARESHRSDRKLSSIASGPFKKLKLSSETVLIKKDDGHTERVSRNRVVVTPTTKAGDDRAPTAKPEDTELIHDNGDGLDDLLLSAPLGRTKPASPVVQKEVLLSLFAT